MWTTPQAFDSNDLTRSQEALARAKEKGDCANLREYVQTFPQPETTSEVGQLLQVWTPPKCPVLNVKFVEKLMGYPVGWSELETNV